jgi:phosphate-selective porin OprO/OprP
VLRASSSLTWQGMLGVAYSFKWLGVTPKETFCEIIRIHCMRKIFLPCWFTVFLVSLLLPGAPGLSAEAQSPPEPKEEGEIGEWWKKLERGIVDPIKGVRYYWQEGLHIDSDQKNIRLKIGGKFMADAGKIDADGTMKNAFPGIEDEKEGIVFRRLEAYVLGTLWDRLDFKFEMDFANIREIKDIWMDFRKIPYLGHLMVGHFGQPMSLEDKISSGDTTFMEKALPVLAFPPGSDMGVMAGNTALGERMTWAAGAFMITGSFSDIGDARNRMSERLGTSLAGRLTYLPWYDHEGGYLLHLGLSYNRQFIDVRRSDSEIRFSARPETYLTDHRIVDTGVFFAEAVEMFNPELAWVAGPLSFQSEYLRTFIHSGETGNPVFWGWYVQGSFFLTGEHRPYNRQYGTFDRVRPKKDFSPFKGHWGAWEMAVRYSILDLSDRGIQGGNGKDFTAGVNWYLYPTMRVMLNYVQSVTQDRGNPPIDRGRLNIYQMRVQLAF